ncbi:MAG: isoprenylcysteine carboxylmethyltransferase family protein [Candidatus Nanopelagicales bacterium]
MTENPSTWRQVRAILQLPVAVTVLVPGCLLLVGRGRVAAHWPPSWISWPLGAALLLAGLWLMVTTIRLFARVGGGTLAPWDHTTRLVVAGPYRYVRNPMIAGVFAVLLSESLLFSSVAVLLWFCGFVVVNLLYMHSSEEPALRRRFGADYDTYADNVPGWIPRLTAWDPPPDMRARNSDPA